jgi:TPP-dependent pyruvate/acetoin dehydrogenase alpha subunit
MKEDQRKMRQKEMAAAWRSQMAIKDVQEKLVSNNSLQQDQEAMRIRDAAELRA